MENTFGVPIIPENDHERLEKLYGYHVLESRQKFGSFQHVATMASQIFKVPIALVSFVDKDQVYFKANVGMEGTNQICRGTSLCSLAILKNEITVFKNAKKEPCLLTNPLVAGDFGLGFYAAAPLITPDGYNIGAVCIVDKKSREFSTAEQALLEGLAKVVMEELEEKQLLQKQD